MACASQPCQNGATCHEYVYTNFYSCECAPGWTGTVCGQGKLCRNTFNNYRGQLDGTEVVIKHSAC